MNEREQALALKEKALLRSRAFSLLQKNPDFQEFLALCEEKKEEYRTLLESAQNIDTVRGGIIALRELVDTFTTTAKRTETLAAEIQELQQK